ncbi:MAG: hypothetical protein KJP23_08620 [Deltaproteobacteria bacterium]|nr:hypothetical protein [Deltaproteobacteria bacterium]
MTANSQLVLFAIQAGRRLYATGRKAYVEATLDRPLILPFPRGPGITAASARTFFKTDPKGKEIAKIEENERIRVLLAAADSGALDSDGEEEFTQIYFTYLREIHPKIFVDLNDPILSDEPKGHEIVAIMTIRQWSKGELGDRPSALQRIAGTLVNIAVDYFVHTPGAISEKRPSGRALKAFLEAIDKLDFAEAPPADIAGDLLISVVESVGTHPDLIGNTETEKKLVQNITTTLSKSAKTHLEDVPMDIRWEGSAWLQMISRAVVKGSFDTVLADPNTVLGVGDPEASFIQEVGGTISDLLIGPDRLRFQALMSGEGVNTVIKSALQATAKNPDILRIDNQGLRNIIVGVADGLSQQPNLLTDDIFPEIARLVLEKSAANLELVWPEGATDPAKHLLITGTRQLFAAIAAGSREKGWPTLTRIQILGIAEVMFDEILENPDWLLEKADLGDDSALGVTVRAALDSLRQVESSKFSSDAAAAVISAAVKATAMRLELLHELSAGGADAGKLAINAAIDAVFESALGDDVSAEEKWIRTRNSTLVVGLEIALNELAKIGPEQRHIDVLRRNFGALIDKRLAAGELAEQLERLLIAA